MAKEQYVLAGGQQSGEAAEVPEQENQIALKPVTILATIEDTKTGAVKNALVKLGITDVSLATLRAEVDDLLSKYDGSKAMYEALGKKRNSIVRTHRTPAKEAFQEERAEAIAFQRLCVAAENLITGFYLELEARLKTQESLYEAEIQRQAEEKARVERERVQGLFNQLKQYEWPGSELVVAQMTPEQFSAELEKFKVNFETVQAARAAEAERKAREEREAAELAEKNRAEAERLRKIEEEQAARQALLDKIAEDQRLAKEKAEAEEAARKQAEEDRKAAALKEIEDARAAALAEVEEAKRRAEQENQQRIDEANRKEQERQAIEEQRLKAIETARAEEEAKQALLAAQEEERRKEAERAPDKDKIVEWCRASWEFVSHIPTLKDQDLQADVEEAAKAIDAILTNLRITKGARI